jgi:hypothetical protein
MPLDLRQSYSEHILRMLAAGLRPLSKRMFIRTAYRAYVATPVKVAPYL